MSKIRAVITHFLFSLTIVSAILAIIFFVWYPAPMFRINGAANVLKTLVGVDLILGPALTAYLYRPGKKGLWIDMWFIVIVQLSALIYGTSVIYQERPQYMIFSQDRYVVLAGKDIVEGPDQRKACAQVQTLPCTAVAALGDSVEARSQLLEKTLELGVELEQLTEFWRPLATNKEKVLSKARPLQAIIDADASFEQAINALAKTHNREISAMVWVPVINKSFDGFCLVIDATTAETLDVIVLDPWGME